LSKKKELNFDMNEILEYIEQKALLNRSQALLSLTLLYQKPVGIGDHSTKDFYKNIDEAFELFCTSEEQLQHLQVLKTYLERKN
tara:strand:+ start:140 stop:391 length:252 start_codon:yes stop_codon:yes gene_type:complete